jgi:hypothetical protein
MSGPLGSSQWMYNSGGDFYPTVIDQSLRFNGLGNSSVSGYLNRTFSTPTSTTTCTLSTWVKRVNIANINYIMSSYNGSASASADVYFDTSYRLNVSFGGASAYTLLTTRFFRDTSAWYHIVIVFDSTQATASNRTKLYVNGVQETVFASASYPALNAVMQFTSSTANHRIGSNWNNTGTPLASFYLADMYRLDGQALDPTSFGEFKNGVWIPKAYEGSYGTNGFHLLFNGNANDDSGNSNNWTVHNIDAGDYMLDSPTNNYATWNPLDTINGTSFSDGNLKLTFPAAYGTTRSTFAVSSGKWYWEIDVLSVTTNHSIGILKDTGLLTTYPGGNSDGYGYVASNGSKYNGSGAVSYGSTYTAGDIIGVALDMNGGSLTYYKNNTSQGVAFTGIDGTFAPAISDVTSSSTGSISVSNFGQSGFTYTPPAGFLALCTANLPEPSISPLYGASPQDYFNTVLYTGNGGTQSITGVGFQPDFTWIKDRTTAYPHMIFDSIRGASKRLISNTANEEATEANTQTSFDAGGFSVGDNLVVNKLSDAFVAWNWKASNAASVLNGAGTIPSQVSANTTAGFSIVSYTGTGANATVGHGLDVKPKVVIVKNRDQAGDWCVFHEDMNAVPQDYYLLLNLPNSPINNNTIWNDTAPTTSTFSIGSYLYGNTIKYIAYCFHDVEGYSKFGSYTGNGSPDGPFIYTGFRPALVLIKRYDAAENWWLLDNKRNPYNQVDTALRPNDPAFDAVSPTKYAQDFLSNGIKLKTLDPDVNIINGTYIYMAFAENPFKYANAR